jgi:hypothetical protein
MPMLVIWRSNIGFPCDKLAFLEVATFFICFYNGFTQEKIVWYAYHDENNAFELPVKFSFDSINTEAESMESFGEAITLGIFPVNFFTSRSHQPSYEFYYPSVAARQLDFGQVPVHLFFADRVKPRETVNSHVEYDRLKNLILDAETVTWKVGLSVLSLLGLSNNGGQTGASTSSVHQLRHTTINSTPTLLCRMMR